MSPVFSGLASPDDEVRQLQRNWVCFLILGALLILIGVAAIAYPVAATLVTMKVVGFFLLVSAGVEFVSAIWAIRWGGFFPHLVSGLLALFLGVILIDRPGLGAAGYTLVMAVYFVAAGLFRIVMALSRQFVGRFWAVLNGAVSLFLGVLIWQDFPESALWVIGTFVGIDLVFSGVSWVMLGVGVRGAPAPAPELNKA
jgi:uncharacterized membrane protein HdeD (DUF308 family)